MCFRRPVGRQGKEQEDGGGDGGCLPGYPEHVIHSDAKQTQTTCSANPKHNHLPQEHNFQVVFDALTLLSFAIGYILDLSTKVCSYS